MTWEPASEGTTPRRVGEALDGVLRGLGIDGGQAAAAVFTGWADAVGPSVAAHAAPIGLHGTTLIVGVDAPAYATQLRILTPELLARLGEIAGRGVIDAVEVRVRA